MARQILASTSVAATTISPHPYHVILNHRGQDSKKTLTSHLYRALVSRGFRVFLDQKELHEGENFESEIEGAIANASCHIAIFSPTYADSEWPLKELVLMLKSGAPILPVFYHVKPSELRRTRGEGEEGWYDQALRLLPWSRSRSKDGVYAKSLGNLKRKKTYDSRTGRKKPRYEPSTIEDWRAALSDVAKKKGLDLQEHCNWDEGELVEKIVQWVVEKVRKCLLPLPKHAIGLDEMVEELERTVLHQPQTPGDVLQQQQTPGKANVVGIVGPSGIGKSTLAKKIINSKRPCYDRSSFLCDVRQNSLIVLQNQLVKDLISLDLKIDNIADGSAKLSQHLLDCQALIVIDGVDNDEQLEALLFPVRTVLRSDSLILLTSCNTDILSRVEGSSIYKMRGLNLKQSQELFCWHAFHQPRPDLGFGNMVRAFSHACSGLPLSLRELGKLLYGKKDMKYWKDQLCRLSKVLPPVIQSRLRNSYDSLDQQDKQIFVSIASSFLGKERDTAVREWERSGWQGALGLGNLENKFLIEVDRKNRLRMSHQLKVLAKYIEENEPPGCPRPLCLPTGTSLITSSPE